MISKFYLFSIKVLNNYFKKLFIKLLILFIYQNKNKKLIYPNCVKKRDKFENFLKLK
jgi:hypothetical protein